MSLKPNVSPHGTVLAVSMMKDEAPYLLEWVAHHLAVGFTDLLVYTNDCTDGTVEMLQRIEELGLGHHRHNVIPDGVKPQPSAIAHAEKEPIVAASDWMMLFDADEFLSINHPSGTIDGMLTDAVARDANGIVITWRIFGSGFVTDWSRAPVTEQYLYAAPPLWRMGWGVKTLFRYDPEYWRLGIHRPKIRNKHLEDGFPDTIHWLNGSGEPMEDYFRFRGWRSIRRTLGYDWAQLNHYAIKSVDSYAIRKFRGNVNNKKDKYNADYWSLQDRNEVRDDRIARHAPRRREIMSALMADPVLGPLHEAAMARVEARLAEFKATDAYAELKESLLKAGEVPITQVTAKPPKARDPEKIAALMSEVEKKSNARAKERATRQPSAEFGDTDGRPYLPGPVDISSPVAVEAVANQGLLVPADPRLFAPDTLRAVVAGKFERRTTRGVAKAAKRRKRMLDASDGFGFQGLVALQAHPKLTVTIRQERADLIGFARRVAELNGCSDRVRFETGSLAEALAGYRPDMLRLHASAVGPADLPAAALEPVGRVLLVQDGDAEVHAAWDAALLALGFAQTSDGARSRTPVYDRA